MVSPTRLYRDSKLSLFMFNIPKISYIRFSLFHNIAMPRKLTEMNPIRFIRSFTLQFVVQHSWIKRLNFACHLIITNWIFKLWTFLSFKIFKLTTLLKINRSVYSIIYVLKHSYWLIVRERETNWILIGCRYVNSLFSVTNALVYKGK